MLGRTPPCATVTVPRNLFVVADGELDVPWDDARPLVVLGGVAGELEQLGGQVLEDGGEVDRRSRTDTLGESPLAEEPRHAADGELQTCPNASCGLLHLGRLLGPLGSLALGWHDLNLAFLSSSQFINRYQT